MGLTRADIEAGWPESFNVVRIAVLQRPYQWNKERMDTNGKALCSAYIDGLKAACTAQKIDHIASTKTIQPRVVLQSPKSEYAQESWLRRDSFLVSNGRISLAPPKPQVVTEYTVTAPAFAAWLAAQGETPSQHIQAWFNAVGVAGAVTPDSPGAVMPANDGPATLTTNQIAGCFAGLHGWDFDHWKSNLQTPPKWLIECRDKSGQRGKPITEATWFPVKIAVAVASKDKSAIRKIYQKFKSMDDLKPWLESLEINLPSSQ